MTNTTDPALWHWARIGKGQPYLALTEEGRNRSFMLGAGCTEDEAKALMLLWSQGGQGALTKRGPSKGDRLLLTDLGRIPQTVWASLSTAGLVTIRGEVVTLTPNGRKACHAGQAEQEKLLKRCKDAAKRAGAAGGLRLPWYKDIAAKSPRIKAAEALEYIATILDEEST